MRSLFSAKELTERLSSCAFPPSKIVANEESIFTVRVTGYQTFYIRFVLQKQFPLLHTWFIHFILEYYCGELVRFCL